MLILCTLIQLIFEADKNVPDKIRQGCFSIRLLGGSQGKKGGNTSLDAHLPTNVPEPEVVMKKGLTIWSGHKLQISIIVFTKVALENVGQEFYAILCLIGSKSRNLIEKLTSMGYIKLINQ